MVVGQFIIWAVSYGRQGYADFNVFYLLNLFFQLIQHAQDRRLIPLDLA
jgi:hypothetical protein